MTAILMLLLVKTFLDNKSAARMRLNLIQHSANFDCCHHKTRKARSDFPPVSTPV